MQWMTLFFTIYIETSRLEKALLIYSNIFLGISIYVNVGLSLVVLSFAGLCLLAVFRGFSCGPFGVILKVKQKSACVIL